MAKTKVAYVCNECGSEAPKWAGQCTDCGAWNCMTEIVAMRPGASSKQAKGYAGSVPSLQKLAEIEASDIPRTGTGCGELDRVLGGGLVPGAVTLIGGDPGVGKSTLLLQTAAWLAPKGTVLYVSGEESPRQIALRAKRLGSLAAECQVLSETAVENIIQTAQQIKPSFMVIDSIQTMHMLDIPAAAGGVSQVRESAAALARYAKQTNTSIFLVGHVTKTGEVAGPRVLEHIVDTVIFMEGQEEGRYRLLRSVKNRFGSVNELGVFAMTEQGLKSVKNPSAIFLSRPEGQVSGSAITVLWEGTRPLLVEMQTLLDEAHAPAPRRVTVGIDQNRLAMLLAVLHRHGGLFTSDQDVFVNVVGGVRVSETSADLAVIASAVSSLKNTPIPNGCIIFGEVGLSGEIRPVPYGQERLREAAKQGFTQAIVPKANQPKNKIEGIKVQGITHLREMLELI